ncbi:MAG: hypothetical protein JNJ57_20740 [Saprospiraceae bacterium]|nr:hypothetical protein [Saprospiraceae bacterium]
MKTILPYHKRFPAFVLLVLVSFQGIGWFLVWKALHMEAKLHAHTIMRQQQNGLSEITLSIQEFEQVKLDKKEILLNGCLFDFRNPTILGDSIHLELYHDVKEQQLLSLLHPHFSRINSTDHGATPPLNYWVAQWLTMPYVVPGTVQILPAVDCSATAQFRWLFPAAQTNSKALFQPPREA